MQMYVHNQQSQVHAVEALNDGILTLLMTAVCRSHMVDVRAMTIALAA